MYATSREGRQAHAVADSTLVAAPTRFSARTAAWFYDALESMRRDGFAIVEDVLTPASLQCTREAMYHVQERIRADVGAQRLERAGELGVLRLMLRHERHFYALLEIEEVLAIVDASLSSAAILHLQNGLIVAPRGGRCAAERFQMAFHRDFSTHLGGYVASINTVLAIDEFTETNGAPLLVPGSHQRADAPTREEMVATAVPGLCPAGSMIVFDSTLWHAAGANRSRRACLSINQQFTRSFIRPQIDYVRALGDEMVLRCHPRTQQLLGWYTRVVASLDEFYGPADGRLLDRGRAR